MSVEHIKSAGDLVTTTEATRAGFVALALEKNRKAAPLIAEARALKSAIAPLMRPAQLLDKAELQDALLTAAGVSDKSSRYFRGEGGKLAIREFIANFLEPAGADWREELVYRFLLTRGDALGGAMRNATGILAQRIVIRALIAQLSLEKIPYFWQQKQNAWQQGDDLADAELDATALTWIKNGAPRALVFNLDVPQVLKNVDLVLLSTDARQFSNFRIAIGSPEKHLALGELKGGVDPAGADEHWKTARTSLARIRDAYKTKNLKPAIFFLGYAIVPDMATEIWNQLQDGTLANAANISNNDQLAAIAHWLLSL
jgi:type II restriction enzyme